MLVDSADIASPLLDWYDRHRRSLPWRAGPGAPPPDPYRVWLSEVMLQQTTVQTVKSYFAAFTTRWPTVHALAAAPEADVMSAWAGLGYYARARNLIACAKVVANDLGGHFPDTEEGLRALPGIGAYTAAAIAAIAFDRPAAVMDANVERVVARLFKVETPLPKARLELARHTATITPDRRPGDFAQAMMDLGSIVCTPRKPTCALCPLNGACRAFAQGEPERLPVKLPKATKPVKRGTIFWLECDGCILLRRRADKGMLGGMRALPTGPWTDADPGLIDAPVVTEWAAIGGGRHVFTHFALDYAVVSSRVATQDTEGEWWPLDRLDEAGLPTLFARAAERARSGSTAQ